MLAATTDPYEDREPMVFLMDESRPSPTSSWVTERAAGTWCIVGCTTVYLPFEVPEGQQKAIRKAVE